VADPELREARAADAEAIASIHADSWRRHYRGAYSDEFLDGDVVEDRRAVWGERLASADPDRLTILAEEGGVPIGFVNAYLAADPDFGTLVDNLHVLAARQRAGLGRTLMAAVARRTLERDGAEPIHLWVLEQNEQARSFYRAIGGVPVQRAPVDPPGGIASRLSGAPRKLRYVWPDAAALLTGRG
jgi:ribosomal protein S18 acetylase RimI-like enzyme